MAKPAIYYYDHSEELEFPPLFQEFNNINTVEEGAVIFSHVGSRTEEAGFVLHAKNRNDVFIIFISTVPSCLVKQGYWPENVTICQKYSADEFLDEWEHIRKMYFSEEE